MLQKNNDFMRKTKKFKTFCLYVPKEKPINM